LRLANFRTHWRFRVARIGLGYLAGTTGGILTGKSALTAAALFIAGLAPAMAQTPPNASDIAGYSGLLAAAHAGDLAALQAAIAGGSSLSETDRLGRMAVHIAAHGSHETVVAALAKAGADVNALDGERYDAVTIAAVANDTDLLRAALAAGNRATNITSRYDGTALIAAAHLGHHEVVRILIDAGAPLDHVNNLGWTAMIEAVVLGDGGPDHQQTLRHLVEAGADGSIPDRNGRTPIDLARDRGYAQMVAILESSL
jgi:ankyrin repeat protein